MAEVIIDYKEFKTILEMAKRFCQHCVSIEDTRKCSTCILYKYK